MPKDDGVLAPPNGLFAVLPPKLKAFDPPPKGLEVPAPDPNAGADAPKPGDWPKAGVDAWPKLKAALDCG